MKIMFKLRSTTLPKMDSAQPFFKGFGMKVDDNHFNLAPFCEYWKSRMKTTL
jgi:hypothetical protein